MPLNPTPSQLDQQQILQRVFDKDNDTLRTDAFIQVDTINADLSVEIDAADGDNISISNADGSKKTSITTQGSIQSLDVNIVADVAIRLDDTSTINVTYVGYASMGALEAAASWKIKKIDETSGISITWADGNNSFDNIWNNRTSLTYS